MGDPQPATGIPPPANVVLHYTDGRQEPVDSLYTGLEDDGHRWLVVIVPTPDVAELSTVTVSIKLPDTLVERKAAGDG